MLNNLAQLLSLVCWVKMSWAPAGGAQVQELERTGEGRGYGCFLPVCHRPLWVTLLSAVNCKALSAGFGRGDSREDLCFQVAASTSHAIQTAQEVVLLY